jgi:transcriptional regulator with XRE-family HTH domain
VDVINIGPRIRELRLAKGLTQLELAVACGLTCKSTVGKWEAGISAPRARLLPLIAAALGVVVAALYEPVAADAAEAQAGEAA